MSSGGVVGLCEKVSKKSSTSRESNHSHPYQAPYPTTPPLLMFSSLEMWSGDDYWIISNLGGDASDEQESRLDSTRRVLG
ncbi:hypothetical protein PRIPAC_88292 [Pristionchus pacificus]|uniref:Uncharacterized protein n=1 Tax=Pristionchus pacificus TaxID=54126 RepID=A0A2A6CYU1_PRIPA|nr:hypothetical protein PRIPAC_88292 [Pristionchus pacificus]|eukprot:PDM83227.1 hypothetical protein PRIPAC_34859 [Pristionchus pacificus]